MGDQYHEEGKVAIAFTGRKKPETKKRWSVMINLVIGIISLGVGIGVGCIIAAQPCYSPPATTETVEDGNTMKTENIVDNVDPKNIRDFHRQLKSHPDHVVTDGSSGLANKVASLWREQGLEGVEQISYKVLLPSPGPYQVHVIDGHRKEIFRTNHHKRDQSPVQLDHTMRPFNTYSQPGYTDGKLVYVNYCRRGDFNLLINKWHVNITGHIAICRRGKIFGGSKVRVASKHGMVGVIVYSDPFDDVGQEEDLDPWQFPPPGFQRGYLLDDEGDPLTPGFPATERAYGWNISGCGIVTIPVTFIGCEDALQLMRKIGGLRAPPAWKGNMDTTYRLGPGFKDKEMVVHLDVNTEYTMVNTTNVIGYIRGSVEADRYVIIGNHRDARASGGVDTTSGTAVMTEITRVFGKFLKEGWRPRRTIVFCSWGSEDLSSTEWIEEYVPKLDARAVIYINVDSAVVGNHSFLAQGASVLHSVMYDVAKKIKNAAGDKSIYEEWLNNYATENGKPRIMPTGRDSEHGAFVTYGGIPCINAVYLCDRRRDGASRCNSVNGTFTTFDEYIDPGFKASAAMGKYIGEMVRYMADSIILPLNVTTYGNIIMDKVEGIRHKYGQLMKRHNISIVHLGRSAINFFNMTKVFDSRQRNINIKNPMEVRMYNDRIMLLERYFLDSQGLHNNPTRRHLPHKNFSGLIELLDEIESLEECDMKEDMRELEEVKKNLSTIVHTINSAANILRQQDYI